MSWAHDADVLQSSTAFALRNQVIDGVQETAWLTAGMTVDIMVTIAMVRFEYAIMN